MKPYSTTIWDPGIDHDPAEINKLLKINVYSFIYLFLATVMAVEVDYGADTDMKEESRTELDPHANMSVVG